MSIFIKQAYAEVDTFINLLGSEYINKIPIKLRNFFANEKDNNYIVQIDPNISIEEQKLREETLAIIALLNLKYWCTDEKEIARLKEIYQENENIYQKELREKYDPNNIFKDKEKEQMQTEVTDMIEYKEPTFFKKIIDKIKKFFNIKRN